MRLTNRTGLPEPVLLMAERYVNSHPTFDDNKYSVTELLKSIRQIVLSRRLLSQRIFISVMLTKISSGMTLLRIKMFL